MKVQGPYGARTTAMASGVSLERRPGQGKDNCMCCHYGNFALEVDIEGKVQVSLIVYSSKSVHASCSMTTPLVKNSPKVGLLGRDDVFSSSVRVMCPFK